MLGIGLLRIRLLIGLLGWRVVGTKGCLTWLAFDVLDLAFYFIDLLFVIHDVPSDGIRPPEVDKGWPAIIILYIGKKVVTTDGYRPLAPPLSTPMSRDVIGEQSGSA